MEIQIEGLRFERDRRVVLDIPSLRFRAGRRTAILGKNGSGKTTLLRLIAALEGPTTGEIRIDGNPVRPQVATRQTIAFVFQNPVFLSQSVHLNLDLGLELRRIPVVKRRERILEAAELLGIVHLLDRRADRLSGGEARRVSLARALCLRAPVVLLDEPLSGLDPPDRARLADELPSVLRAFGATTLLVTHDRDEALRLADDLVVLVEGRPEAAGSKREVIDQVRTRAVAEILGYTLLPLGGERVAVPPGALRIGGGVRQWRLAVEEVVDLLDRWEIVGRIGDQRVRVALDQTPENAQVGEPILVHAVSSAIVVG